MTDRTFKLIIIWTVGLLIALPVAGLIGFYLAYAKTVGVPELQYSPVRAFTDGLAMVMHSPRRVFEAGLQNTAAWSGLLILFVLGAALLTVAHFGPHEDSSDDTPKRGVVFGIMSALGAVICILMSAVQLGWVVVRKGTLVPDVAPWTLTETRAEWVDGMSLTAGLDVIGVIVAVVWFLFALRLVLPRWLKVLTLAAAGIALASSFVTWSLSNSLFEQMELERSVVMIEDRGLSFRSPPSVVHEYLVLGQTSTHMVLLDEDEVVKLHQPTVELTVGGRLSLIEYLGE